MFEEFKTFISKGNVLGLAIGIIIGGAFNDIVNSLINDVIMPVIGRLLSNVSFKTWYIPLNGEHYDSFAQAQAAGAPMITIGNFISAVINFFIIALVLFFIMKAANKATEVATKKAKEEAAAAPAEPSEEVKLLTEIRDYLKADSKASK
ncbi:MAG: large conductance mechanosensitive channel protein MscL [Anaerolineaceae bacterium]|nr:large conductance mechanosensitive channel protein MscL [Anaerolineaceae bacterium]